MERDKLKKDISKKPTGVFYIDGAKAFFYEQSLSSPLALEFTPDIISDLEVINKKKLDSVVQQFVKTYKLVPKNIIILLSGQVTFEKDFPHGSIEVQKNIEEFLQLVPFEDCISKKTLFSGTTKVVAANRELCEGVKAAFVSCGFVVTGVFPMALCIMALPQLQSNLDLSLVVLKVPELRDFNLLPVVEAQVSSSPEKEKPSRNRLYMLVAVFGVLITILGFFVYKNVLSSPAAPKTLPVVQITPTANVPVVPAVPVSEASSSGQAGITPIAFSTQSAGVQNPASSQ